MGKRISHHSSAYRRHVSRLQNCAHLRCSLLGTPYSDIQLVEQLFLRSTMVTRSTYYVEKAALKNFLLEASTLEAGARKTALERLDTPRAEVLLLGQSLLADMIAQAINAGDMRAEEEIATALHGYQPARPQSAKNRKRPLITVHDVDELTSALTMGDPLNVLIDRLRKHRPTTSKALSAVLLHTAWLTGMRPIEMFSCAVLIVRDGVAVISPEALDGLVPSIAQRDDTETGGLTLIGRKLLEIEHKHDGRLMLAIRNAKVTNANQDTVQAYRLQRLTGIDPYRLGVLWLASQLRRLKISRTEIDNLRDLASRHVRDVSRMLRPGHPSMSLYSMRHDFADRAKHAYSRAEVAALMGHTGKNSGSHYGRKGLRQSSIFNPSKTSRGGWLPSPDQAQAALLFAKWNPKLAMEPAVKLASTARMPDRVAPLAPEQDALPTLTPDS